MKNFKRACSQSLLALLIAGFLPVWGESQLAEAETLDSDGIITNGTVYDTATYGTTTYLGGSFTYVGPNTGGGVPVKISTSAPVATYPSVNKDVNVVISDGSGGWYVGGDFTSIGGVSKTNLAHVNSSGAVDTGFTANPNYPVQSLLLDGSTLYVGGAFSSIGGQSYSYLASVSASTGTANTWDAQVDSTVYDMALDGSTLYIVGMFTNAGGSYRSKAAALDTGTATATSWNPYVEGTLYAIELDATYAYLGGSFWAVSSTSVNNLASYSLAGSLSSWRPQPSSGVNDLELDGTTLYVGGDFTTIDSTSRSAVAAFDTGTGSVTSWDPNVTGGSSNGVNEIELSGSTLFVGGNFTTVGSSTRYNVAGINTSTASATSFDPYAGGPVNGIAVSADTANLYVGGTFKSIGSGTAKKVGLAAINNSTGSVLTFDANISGGSQAVYALDLNSDGSTLYAGGSFTTCDGSSRQSLCAITTSSGNIDTGFDASIGSSSTVYALLLSGTSLYVGGGFSSFSTSSRNNLAEVSPSTGIVTSWDPNITGGFSAYVYALAKSGSTLYAGGNFTTVGGTTTRNHLAAIDTSTGAATSWDPSLSGMMYGTYVRALALSGSTLYVGGNFTTVGSDSRAKIAAIDTSTGAATSWAPDADGIVYDMAVTGSTLYVGGDFSTLGGSSRAKVGALSTSTGSATTWNPGADNTVYTTDLSSGNLFVGGNFNVFESIPMFYLAHYTVATNSAPSATISSATQRTDGTGVVDIAVAVDDADDDDTVKLKVEYKAGTDCSTSGSDPTLDETDANTTSTYGDPKVENDDGYQVGNASGYITTSSGANTVSFDWDAMTDLSSVDSTTYCLRVTPSDGTDIGTVATTTVTIDNVVNVPGSVSLSAVSTSQINMTWGDNSNPTGTEYYAENTTAGTNSGWTTVLSWSSSSLTCGTSYSFRVKARNVADVETAFVSGSSVNTLACPDGSGLAVSLYSSSANRSGEEDESDDEVEDSVEEEPVADSVEESNDSEEEVTQDETRNAIEVVTGLVIDNVAEPKLKDDFANTKKIEKAISVVKDTVTNKERVNYDLLIKDDQQFEVSGDASEEPMAIDLEANWPEANNKFLDEDLAQVNDVLKSLSGEKEKLDLGKVSDAERVIEDKVDKQVREKLNELLEAGGGKESFELRVGDRKLIVDRDTQVYVTLDSSKAKRMQNSADQRGENKLIIGPSTMLGDSTVSAALLAMAGAPLDDAMAGEKYFFGGFDGLKKRGIVYPDKPVFTNDLEGRTAGESVMLWVGAPKKGEKLNLFAVDKVDPENKNSWKVYDLDEDFVDDGNKAAFSINFREDLPINFDEGKKHLFFVVQDQDGHGSVMDFDIDVKNGFSAQGVKLSNNLVSFDDGAMPEGIKDPMGDVMPDGIKDPMGMIETDLYTSVLLAQADMVKDRDLVVEGPANVKYMAGYALPGSTVVITWKSLTYSSVVIADASQGYFEVEVPNVLEAGNHEAIVYVYNDSENLISNITSLLFGKGRADG